MCTLTRIQRKIRKEDGKRNGNAVLERLESWLMQGQGVRGHGGLFVSGKILGFEIGFVGAWQFLGRDFPIFYVVLATLLRCKINFSNTSGWRLNSAKFSADRMSLASSLSLSPSSTAPSPALPVEFLQPPSAMLSSRHCNVLRPRFCTPSLAWIRKNGGKDELIVEAPPLKSGVQRSTVRCPSLLGKLRIWKEASVRCNPITTPTLSDDDVRYSPSPNE
jgi:hypothetical protein